MTSFLYRKMAEKAVRSSQDDPHTLRFPSDPCGLHSPSGPGLPGSRLPGLVGIQFPGVCDPMMFILYFAMSRSLCKTKVFLLFFRYPVFFGFPRRFVATRRIPPGLTEAGRPEENRKENTSTEGTYDSSILRH